jgi:hypothetical protein
MNRTKTVNAIRESQGKRLLQKVVEYLNEGDEHSQHMWGILSALRGPDHIHPDAELGKDVYADMNLKGMTTARTRFAMGMRNNAIGAHVSTVAPDVEDASKVGAYDIISVDHVVEKYKKYGAPYHFATHHARGVSGLIHFGFMKKEESK